MTVLLVELATIDWIPICKNIYLNHSLITINDVNKIAM